MYVLTLLLLLFSLNISSTKKLTADNLYENPIWEYFDYLKCQVCKNSMKNAVKYNNKIKNDMKNMKKKKKITRDNYKNFLKLICDPYHKFGSWITKFDIIRQNNKLIMNNTNEFGECNRECNTIAFICEKNIFSNDYNILINLLIEYESYDMLYNQFCLDSACYHKNKDKKIEKGTKIINEKHKKISIEERIQIENKARNIRNSEEFKKRKIEL